MRNRELEGNEVVFSDDAAEAEIQEDERLWDVQFAASPDLLASLADEARADHGAGRTQPLEPDSL